MYVAKFRLNIIFRIFQCLMIGGYLDELEKYDTTGPCYRTINIIRKIRYRDSDYFTRTRLIDLINTKILSILYSIYFLGNLIYLFTGIELSGLYTLPSLSKKLQVMYTRKNNRIITRDFII